MKPSIANILTIHRAIMLPAAEGALYSWDDEFKQKNASDSARRIADLRVDFSDLTDAEAELLGFPIWSKESGIRLIPLWLYRHIGFGQTLACIDGSTVRVGLGYEDRDSPDYIDNDHRGGALAYGFVPATAPPVESIRELVRGEAL